MSQAPQKNLWQDVRRWLPGVFISLVAVVLIFTLARTQDLGKAFQSLPPLNIFIALVLSALSLVVRSVAWKMLLENKPSFRQAFFILNEGYLLNNLFPLRAGEIARAVFMGRAIKVSPFHVLSTIVIERAFDIGIAAALLLSTLPLALGLDYMKPVGFLTLILVIAGFVVLFLMARYPERVHDLALRLGGRWKLIQKYIIPQVDSLLDGLSALRSPRQFLLSVFWIAFTWVFWVAVYYVMLLAIAPSAPLWWALFVDSALAAFAAIPSAPASVGIYEGSLMGALSLLGIATSTALAYAIVMHVLQIVLTGILGLWGLAREQKSLGSIQADIRLEKPSVTE